MQNGFWCVCLWMWLFWFVAAWRVSILGAVCGCGSIIEKSVQTRFESLGVCLYNNRIRQIHKKEEKEKQIVHRNQYFSVVLLTSSQFWHRLVWGRLSRTKKSVQVVVYVLGCRPVRSIMVILWVLPSESINFPACGCSRYVLVVQKGVI